MYTNKEEIENWLNSMRVKKYIINDDLTVDINGPVDLFGIGLRELPVQFGVVRGAFNCGCNSLTSFKGSPKMVLGPANYIHNYMSSLEYSPEHIGGSFLCDFTKINSLKFSPKKIDGIFSLVKTPIIELFLDELPHTVRETISFSSLKNLNKIKYFEDKYEDDVLIIKLEHIKSVLLENTLSVKEKENRVKLKKI